MAGLDQAPKLGVVGRRGVVLDVRPVLVEDERLDGQLPGAVENREIGRLGAVGLRLHAVEGAVADALLVGVARDRLHGSRMEAKRVGERPGELSWHSDQLTAEDHRIAFASDAEGLVGVLRAPALVRLAEPAEAALLVAEPDERLERQIEAGRRKSAGVVAAAPFAGPEVVEGRVLRLQGHDDAESLDAHRFLRRQGETETHHSVELHGGRALQPQVCAVGFRTPDGLGIGPLLPRSRAAPP